jgi:HSP20 family molecular chaperone IbpA
LLFVIGRIKTANKMRKLEGITTELLTSIDVLNTLGGGVAEPQVRLSQHPAYRQVELSIPGIPQEQIKAEVHNNQLTIYFNFHVVSSERLIKMPKVVYNKQIPYFIDSKKISASFEDNTLIVKLPFNELANGYHRDITAAP